MEIETVCCWVLLCEHQGNPGRRVQLSQAKKAALEVWANAVYGDYFSSWRYSFSLLALAHVPREIFAAEY